MSKRTVEPIEIVARQAWDELHKDMDPGDREKRRNENWVYWLTAWEKAAKRFGYKPTLKEWKAARQASSMTGA